MIQLIPIIVYLIGLGLAIQFKGNDPLKRHIITAIIVWILSPILMLIILGKIIGKLNEQDIWT